MELVVPHPPYCMENNHVHMVLTTLDVLKEPHVDDYHEEGVDLQMLVKRYEEENIGQALIEIERKDEVFLEMGNMPEEIPIESAIKDYYLFMDWVDKYITKTEAQGCTSLACICKELLDMHALKKRLHELSIWRKYLYLKKVVDYISHRSTSQSVYSSIGWGWIQIQDGDSSR